MIADRVMTTVAGGGTGALTLGAAVPGYRHFNTVWTSGVTQVEYLIIDGTAWETGTGAYTFNGTLARGLSASSTGALLNVSTSATVSVAYLSKAHVPDWPVLVVERNNSDANPFYNTANAFTTIAWDNANGGNAWPATTDTHGGWNKINRNEYTVQQTGLYDCQLKVRVADPQGGGPGAGISHGLGIDIINADSPGFQWSVTAPNRSGSYNSRLMPLTAGQQLRAFVYYDNGGSFGPINSAAFAIQRVR
jgi:hypothetical protein